MVKYILATIFVVILVFAYRTANYVGAFKDVQISISEEPAKKLLFKTHIGAYHKIVPVIEEVEKWAKDQGIDCHLSFGEYLDNPDVTEEARLKSHGGCVVSEFPKQMPEGFESKDIPAQKYVMAVFEGSPGIGPLKVYPKVQKFAEENRVRLTGVILEIYEIHSQTAMTTRYLFFME